jgi:hypothetical protein
MKFLDTDISPPAAAVGIEPFHLDAGFGWPRFHFEEETG